MTTSKYTLQDALAAVAILGRKNGMTVSTRIALMDYCDYVSGQGYKITEEGMELARKSRVWKCHEEMLRRGLKVDHSFNGNRASHISYVGANRHGFTSKGRVYLSEECGRWLTKKVAEFKNG